MEMAVEPKEKKGPDEYEIKCWADKIIEAEEIKSDPEKMKLVAPILQKKKAAVEKISGLDALKAKIKDKENPAEEAASDEEMD